MNKNTTAKYRKVKKDMKARHKADKEQSRKDIAQRHINHARRELAASVAKAELVVEATKPVPEPESAARRAFQDK